MMLLYCKVAITVQKRVMNIGSLREPTAVKELDKYLAN